MGARSSSLLRIFMVAGSFVGFAGTGLGILFGLTVVGLARVSVEFAARYGTVLPELAAAVQRSVAAALAGSAGLTVESVDVAIEELER